MANTDPTYTDQELVQALNRQAQEASLQGNSERYERVHAVINDLIDDAR